MTKKTDDRRPAELAPIPFTAPYPVTHLDREATHPVDLAVPEDKLLDVAAYMGVASIETVAFTGELSAWGEAGWRVSGTLTAHLVQTCVVTLSPVPQEVDEPVSRVFVPIGQISDEDEVTVDLDEDSPDPFSEAIELGAMMLEELSLALDPYPRAEGAELETRIFAAPGVEPMTDEDARPFAKLAALKEKLGGLG